MDHGRDKEQAPDEHWLSEAETLHPDRPSEEPTDPPPSAIPMRSEERIGHYRLRRVIASGGMGTVYEAMQEAPRRLVAVKVLKHDIASPASLRRFEYESQILARLVHPNIAQVYEAGIHDDGTGAVPFFAMEFVHGARTITDYCKEKHLTVEQKLRLFLDICDAVHHGHQKGIIHRDLKPPNILVDSSGHPKIIDFGVARAIDSDVAMATMQTEVGQLVGTVQYMSPEQIEADPHDIDTRSDVYSLGIVLYQLLTGKLPYDVSKTPIYEATRIVREQQPRQLRQFNATLPGDLETIVLHALEKERERRYQSAAQLREDIRRYLNNESIIAHPPSVLYRIRVFTRRNRGLVVGLVALFLVLVFGIIGTTVGMTRAQEASVRYREEADTANLALEFWEDAFASIDAREELGPDVRVVDQLDVFADRIEQELFGQPEVRARLSHAAGNGYKSLSAYDRAEPLLQSALDLRRDLKNVSDETLARNLHDLGEVLWLRGKYEQAGEHFSEAIDLRTRVHGPDHLDVAESLNHLAATNDLLGHHDVAEEQYRRSLQIRVDQLGPDHELVARSKNNLARCLMNQGAFSDAEPLLREAVTIVRASRGPDHVDVAGGLSNLARCLVQLDRPLEAQRLFTEALEIKRASLAEGHASIAITLHHLAQLLADQGRHDDARAYCEEALEIRRQRLDETDSRLHETIELLATIHSGLNDHGPAESLLRELLEIRQEANPLGDRETALARIALGSCLLKQSRFDDAEPLLLEAYQYLTSKAGSAETDTIAALKELVDLYQQWDRPEQAQQYQTLLARVQDDR